MSIKITRTLFVGLGGTGVKAILRTKQCFMDAYGEIPPMVAFLAIDTDMAIRDMYHVARNGKEVKLADNEICFCGIDGSALAIYRNNLSNFQWIPKRNVPFLANLQNTGAGQVRSCGRFLARHNSTEISRRIAGMVTEIGKAVPMGGKFAFDTNKDGVEYPTLVNVVGSVAGGTGSGMMLDVLVLIAKTLRQTGRKYSITPWMVLPDVFSHMMPGPASGNVMQNAYGAIRELDYLYHLPKDNQDALDFYFDKVYHMPEGIGDAYLVNNYNKSGVSFQHIDDIADSIGRCMFLPSNEVDSVMDNDSLRPEYHIKNKEAHYVSAGSAELVYDNQAVGNVIAKGIITQICNELVASQSVDALREVNTWTKSEAVAIQEHEVDLLTDSLLPQFAPFPVIIDKDADVSTINANIIAGADAENVKTEVKDNEERKLAVVKAELDKKLEELLNALNGIGAAKSFLESLSDNIAICKDEMAQEATKLTRELAYDVDWESEVAGLRTGIFKLFDKDAAEVLQTKVSEYIAKKRDLLRHNWAIQFYTELNTYVNTLLQSINVLKSKMENVERIQRRDINAIQNLAKSTSMFQIYLHSSDVENFVLPAVAETSALFREQYPIHTLVGKSEEELIQLLFDFAKEQQAFVDAVNVSIEQKMSSMPEAQLKAIFSRVKEMSSPLWSTNTQGYLDHSQELTTVFTIGVCNQGNTLLRNQYIDVFTMGSIKPSFASTHETDRITFFQTQFFSPAYAVNNMLGYMNSAQEKLTNHETYPVYYIDEKWNQRMNVEGFDLLPAQEKNRVLPNWVNAIVYGLIKFDEERQSYVIKSKQGNKLFGGILDLGQRRDVAFDNFQLRGLDKEVEDKIQQMVLEQGRPAIVATIKEVKNNTENYIFQYAQLSRIELDRVCAEDKAYQMVREQLEAEIEYLEETNF